MSAEDVELLKNLNASVCLPTSGAVSWKRPREDKGRIQGVIRDAGIFASATCDGVASCKSDTLKKAERKERNRLSAERHRKKQREYTEKLECVPPSGVSIVSCCINWFCAGDKS